MIIPAGHTRDVQDLDATVRIKARQHSWPKDMDPKTRQEQFTREMMQNVRLYPPLQLPIVAFHNLGNCRFEAANQYFYVPLDLAEKVVNCRDLLDRWLPEQRRRWSQ